MLAVSVYFIAFTINKYQNNVALTGKAVVNQN